MRTMADDGILSDDELVRRLLLREDRAWRAFYARYERILRSAIRRVLGRWRRSFSAADVDDVYAAVLLSLFEDGMRRLRSYRSAGNVRFASWVAAVARNASLDHVRAAVRRSGAADALRYAAQAERADESAALLAREQCEILCETIAALSQRDRQLVHLLFVRCATAAEVACMMSISINTVYTKKYKIGARCRRALSSRTLRQPAPHAAMLSETIERRTRDRGGENATPRLAATSPSAAGHVDQAFLRRKLIQRSVA